jgi:hypothetical protein
LTFCHLRHPPPVRTRHNPASSHAEPRPQTEWRNALGVGLKAALERLARAEERTLNFYIERVLETHLEIRRKKGDRR